MATCMVVYASGEVQVVECYGEVWFGAFEVDGYAVVRFGDAVLGQEDVPRAKWDGARTVADYLDEWAAANAVLAVQVNGVTVWPLELPSSSGAQERR